MCLISDKLILNPCSASNAVTARHYWIFYRWTETKNHLPIGAITVPNSIDREIDIANRQTLLKVINQPNIVNTELRPVEGDKLALTFTTSDELQVKYGFEFVRGEWHETTFDPIKWMSQHHEEKFGRIENAWSARWVR